MSLDSVTRKLGRSTRPILGYHMKAKKHFSTQLHSVPAFNMILFNHNMICGCAVDCNVVCPNEHHGQNFV
jgi:hypothetical protein